MRFCKTKKFCKLRHILSSRHKFDKTKKTEVHELDKDNLIFSTCYALPNLNPDFAYSNLESTTRCNNHLNTYRIYVHKVQQFIFFPFISIILNNIMKFHTKLDIKRCKFSMTTITSTTHVGSAMNISGLIFWPTLCFFFNYNFLKFILLFSQFKMNNDRVWWVLILTST